MANERHRIDLTIFDAVTRDAPTLANFLRSLPVLEGPWNTEFQSHYCAKCIWGSCDECPNEDIRDNPLWWLTLPAAKQSAERPGMTIVYEDDEGRKRCGVCEYILLRDKNGDMPERCPRCGEKLDYQYYEE